MDTQCLYLFVYGTLLDTDNEFAAFLRKHCSFVKRGKFKGILYDIGEYPGAVFNNKIDGYVHGSIYLMSNATQVLEKLDDYEGFGDDQEQPNLFIRQLVEIETNSRAIDCWVYLYNREVGGLPIISKGDYPNLH
jgi:gamma-glutamylcyclotransferase (GGCT)/AIG2-like uncharacterized protein YtfP